MAITQINVTDLKRDTFEDVTAGGVFQNTEADGMYIEADEVGKGGALFFHFKNTEGVAKDITFKAGTGGDTGPAWRAVLGDYVYELEATAGEAVMVLCDLARFRNADGRIYFDIESETSCTVAVYRLPL